MWAIASISVAVIFLRLYIFFMLLRNGEVNGKPLECLHMCDFVCIPVCIKAMDDRNISVNRRVSNSNGNDSNNNTSELLVTSIKLMHNFYAFSFTFRISFIWFHFIPFHVIVWVFTMSPPFSI